MNYLFPNGKRKALTLSYDDGVLDDVKLVNILNSFHIKATFNLNSGIQNSAHVFEINGYPIARLPKETVINLYTGHEVAIHSLTHPDLTTLKKDAIHNELHQDKLNLEHWFDQPIIGMAYPFGTYSNDVMNIMTQLQIKYGRTINDTFKFSLPDNFLCWHPTCHHNHPELLTYAKEFIEDNSSELKLFYVWGHSYEFELDNNWDVIESFCSSISHQDSIWYATNGEIYNYIQALKQLEINNNQITNHSNHKLWFEYHDNTHYIEPNSILIL